MATSCVLNDQHPHLHWGKIIHNICKSAAAADDGGRSRPTTTSSCFYVALLLNGALNPVHKGHTAILHAARTALEGQEHEGRPIKVVGLVLSPSSDNYVGGKLKGDAMSLVHRNAMCALASAEDPLMHYVETGLGSGSKSCDVVQKELRREWGTCFDDSSNQSVTAQCSSVSLPPNINIDDDFICLPLYGSDFLLRYPHTLKKPIIIASRVDTDGSAFAAAALIRERAEEVHPWFRYLPLPLNDDDTANKGSPLPPSDDPLTVATPSPSTPLSTPLTQSVPDISSTMMRQAFKTLQQPTTAKTPEENAAAMACLKQHLHGDVLEYLLQNNFCTFEHSK